MKRLLLLAAASLSAASVAHAAYKSFTFDNVPAGTLASSFNQDFVSFHNAVFAPKVDADGVDIPGSSYWQIDFSADALFPLTVESPFEQGWGDAPSGANALDARFGPVLLQFSRPFLLKSFWATLDNSTFGDAGVSSALFLSGTSIVGSINFDASTPLLQLGVNGLADVTGVVLPGGAFYDDIKVDVKAVPDVASTLGLAALSLGLLGWVARRR